ncbi:uncharacterized protein ACWYII_033730 [Salvelinus alpinus]
MNIYFTQLIYVAMEMPGKIAVYHFLNKIGRKPGKFGTLLLIGACVFIIIFAPRDPLNVEFCLPLDPATRLLLCMTFCLPLDPATRLLLCMTFCLPLDPATRLLLCMTFCLPLDPATRLLLCMTFCLPLDPTIHLLLWSKEQPNEQVSILGLCSAPWA